MGFPFRDFFVVVLPISSTAGTQLVRVRVCVCTFYCSRYKNACFMLPKKREADKQTNKRSGQTGTARKNERQHQPKNRPAEKRVNWRKARLLPPPGTAEQQTERTVTRANPAAPFENGAILRERSKRFQVPVRAGRAKERMGRPNAHKKAPKLPRANEIGEHPAMFAILFPLTSTHTLWESKLGRWDFPPDFTPAR